MMGLSYLAAGELVFGVRSVVVARRAFRLMKAVGLGPRMTSIRPHNRIQYTMRADLAMPVHLKLACTAQFVAGWFLVRGYLAHPDKGPAHLELLVPLESDAAILVRALDTLHIRAKTVPRRGGTSVYLKDRTQIRALLGKVGAHRAVLQWESVDVVRHMKNQVNRLVNSETANLRRAVESGLTQAALLQSALGDGQDGDWDEVARALAWLRIKHPDWSLRELGQALTPPLSKSAVNHRMRRLLQGSKDRG